MKIAVDAMGGDHAPEAVIKGSLLAMKWCDADLVLVGDELQIRRVLERLEYTGDIGVVNCQETIGMEEAGSVAIRKKANSSSSVAMRLLAQGEVAAVVSAGNSSAVVAAAKHFVGLVPGLRRPALIVPIPTHTGRVFLADAGAHVDAEAVNLAQSAALASCYLQVTECLDHPRVGLLNIGREPGKGTRVIQRAFTMLNRSSLHFAGNIEPQDLFSDSVDAAVCDGFTGNLVLKMVEGVSETLVRMLEEQLKAEKSEPCEKLRRSVRLFQGAHHYPDIGGAPLLGIGKTVVMAHGRSQPPAIANAIKMAHRLASGKIYERVADELETRGAMTEIRHLNGLHVLETLRSKWGRTAKEANPR
jgi:glycerol-3-phosphate acyltransferase PlsX